MIHLLLENVNTLKKYLKNYEQKVNHFSFLSSQFLPQVKPWHHC